MLTTPQQQTFEQVRARWEAAQAVSPATAKMGGRKTSQTGDKGNSQESGSSKFRRKLSNGLAFISTPLAQRKPTPGSHNVSTAPLTVTDPTAESSTEVFRDLPSIPVEQDTNNIAASKFDDTGATPLLRSRTTSFIPRPVRSNSNASFTALDNTSTAQSSLAFSHSPAHRRSKIPTPSPPPSKQQRSISPRQYIPQYQSLNSHHNAALSTPKRYPATTTGSPVSAAMRSKTTPNLAKVAIPLPPMGYMASRKPGTRTISTSSLAAQSSVKKENVPTNMHNPQRRAPAHGRPFQHSSFVVPASIPERNSSSPNTPQATSKQQSYGTPLATKAPVDAQAALQTPVTLKRTSFTNSITTQCEDTGGVDYEKFMAEAQLAESLRFPTSTRNAFATMSIEQKRAMGLIKDNIPTKRTLGTPNGLGGVWRSSQAMAVSNHEVSRFPRSQTFPNFGHNLESPPPVPAIPERYRTPSLPSFLQTLRAPLQNSSILRKVRKISNMNALGSSTATTNKEHSEVSSRQERESMGSPASITSSYASRNPGLCYLGPLSDLLTLDIDSLSVNSDKSESQSLDGRPWSNTETFYQDDADLEPLEQVRDYMPPQFWAGRFQSKFDLWRSDAMMVELNSKAPASGLLGQCRLSESKMAACYILAQLRDTCLTSQAADSLWEFEYDYRKEHKLLDTKDYPAQPPRKQEEQNTNIGAFGRAVRKLTPRKSSFVNLLKGRSWSKGDMAKPDDRSGQTQDTPSSTS